MHRIDFYKAREMLGNKLNEELDMQRRAKFNGSEYKFSPEFNETVNLLMEMDNLYITPKVYESHYLKTFSL